MGMTSYGAEVIGEVKEPGEELAAAAAAGEGDPVGDPEGDPGVPAAAAAPPLSSTGGEDGDEDCWLCMA